jgi:hypothetical protein
MTRRARVTISACIVVLAAMLIVVARAQASGIATMPVYVNAHQAGDRPVPRPGRFVAIVGYPDQCVRGIPCWKYTKGTRSPVSTYPESWYLHGASGARIHDKTWPRLFVMDPSNPGWRDTVAAACHRHCFLDGAGTSSFTRVSTPLVGWTLKGYIKAVAGEIRVIRAAGKAVLPNSIGFDARGYPLVVAAGGRGSTEAYTVSNARQVLHEGRIWVAERGSCRKKARAFLRFTDGNDHFACYLAGTLPWNTSWR